MWRARPSLPSALHEKLPILMGYCLEEIVTILERSPIQPETKLASRKDKDRVCVRALTVTHHTDFELLERNNEAIG